MGCRTKRNLAQTVLTFMIALVMVVIVPRAEAYKFYSQNVDNVGNCAQCHGEFRAGTYVSQAEGGLSWGDNLHNVHLNNTGVGGNCDNCHGGVDTGTIGRRAVNLSSSAAAADGTNAIACSGCHGRLEDAAGNPNTMGAGWGAGLRQHHINAGAPADGNGDTCLSCHEDADPGAFTVAGENTMPPWYATFGLTACGDNLVGAAIGLDNDGDLCYDGDDTDCGGPGCGGGPVCGDGTPEDPEQCDPPNASPDGCCDDLCNFEPNSASCDNLTVCDGLDECDGAGNCVNVGPPLDCDDGNVCTDDPCDPVNGCDSHPFNTAPCTDNDACTGTGASQDQCSGGACVPGAPVDCNDNEICTDDSCDPATGCVNDPNTLPCDDNDACTENDTCGGGTCQPGTPVDCNDNNACTIDSCDSGSGCVNTLDCGQPGCDGTVDPRCATGCTAEPDPDAFCDDGLYCNGLESCNTGTDACEPGTPPVCDDGLYCNGVETCNEATDSCDPGTAPACDDGAYCNGVETCNEVTDSCDPGTAPACDNGLYCDGVETCDEVNDTCASGTAVNCDNGIYCDGPELCNEATDSCDPGTPINCDDGEYCNGVESCNEGTDSCDPGTPVVCDDGVGCTDDACNETTDSCDYVANNANCPSDGSFCNGVEFCDTVNDCSSPGDPCTPGTESCNETTDSCDPITCIDGDGDGYGNPGDPSCPNGALTDCDDTDALVHPYASEICDGKDTNCDGNLPPNEIDGDGDNVALCQGDCNDADNTVYPGATEVCDGKDNDCAGGIPYTEKDNDNDGVKICDDPTDCNDFDAGTYPGATEICGDGRDNDCDATVDEADCLCPDADGDGFVLAVCSDPGPGDCNDADGSVNPAAAEVCDDGVDNNCDGFVDCQDASCTAVCGCTDADGDGYNVDGGACGPVDCADDDATVHPGAKDICDGKDTNCDGYVKSTDVDNDGDGQPLCAGDCNDNDNTVFKGATEICDGKDNDCRGGIPFAERDNDNDGVRACDVPADCNDYDASTSPNAEEICNDGKDNNCLNGVDETPCVCPDGDGDGYELAACAAPGLGDCNDADPTINPGAAEVCDDQIDNNCNGLVDCNDGGCVTDTFCVLCATGDTDGDGYSTLGVQPEGDCGPVDCDDADPNVHPNAAEICDGKDSNCDNYQSSTDVDNDGDGKALCAGDCNDNDATVYPGAPEICDGKDNDCRGGIPVNERDNDSDGVRLCDVPPDCNDYDAARYPGNTEVCDDGIDNDCDGAIDGVDSECSCIATGIAETICNGVDDDCDNQVDEDYVTTPTSCGVGVCGADGQIECQGGTEVDTCTPGPQDEPTDVTCDGLDGDCDGQVDEDYLVDAGCGVGVCQSTNTPSSCVGGVETACQPGSPTEDPEASCSDGLDNDCDGLTDSADTIDCPICVPTGVSETICNGVDDDCDTMVDEDYVSTPTACGTGVCTATGQMECQGGTEVNTCTPGPQDEPTDVTCDGLDGDCDGSVDEDYVTTGTNCGLGVCAATGQVECQGGSEVDTCTPGPQDESTDVTCDGLDGDCDGAVDEDYVTSPTSCGVGVCAAAGQIECQGGTEIDTCTPGPQDEPTDVTCDGLDGDCDGAVDEDYASSPTSCGVGVCAATGQMECQGGTEVDTCTEGPAGVEGPADDPTCSDGDDNDCDGLTDTLDSDCVGTVDYATQIQPIFDASCTTSKCHDNDKPKGSLDLSSPASNSYSNLVPSRVVPGDRNASILYQKVAPGASMSDELTPAEAELIGIWIDQGANP